MICESRYHACYYDTKKKKYFSHDKMLINAVKRLCDNVISIEFRLNKFQKQYKTFF